MKKSLIAIVLCVVVLTVGGILASYEQQTTEEQFLAAALDTLISQPDDLAKYANDSFIAEVKTLPKYTDYKIREIQLAGDAYDARKAIVDFEIDHSAKIAAHVITMRLADDRWMLTAID